MEIIGLIRLLTIKMFLSLFLSLTSYKDPF